MLSGISPYSTYGAYGVSYLGRAAQTQEAQRPALVLTAQKAHQPDAPVQPVTPVRAVSEWEDPAQAGLLRYDSDPAAMAVRQRIQYPEDAAGQTGAAQAAGDSQAWPKLPGATSEADESAQALGEDKSAREVMEEGECQTCKERKYQDGSDDPGVSYKTPTNVAPERAASAVRGHENEHVVRERAEAQREDRKVVSQSVTYHTDICPECGKVYVSGGTTRTVTKANTDQQTQQQDQQNPRMPAAVA